VSFADDKNVLTIRRGCAIIQVGQNLIFLPPRGMRGAVPYAFERLYSCALFCEPSVYYKQIK
jgi:hypothetical protein